MIESIVLIGPPGSGKSSTGLALAQLLGWRFLDTDKEIEAECGRTVQELFANDGEAQFRLLERRLLESLYNARLNGSLSDSVIATGGGMPVGEGNFALLSALGEVVYLTAALPALVTRLKSTGGRPLLASTGNLKEASAGSELAARLATLLAERENSYGQAAHCIDTTALAPETVAREILTLFNISP